MKMERYLARRYWYHFFNDNKRREALLAYLYLWLYYPYGFLYRKWTKQVLRRLLGKKEADEMS